MKVADTFVHKNPLALLLECSPACWWKACYSHWSLIHSLLLTPSFPGSQKILAILCSNSVFLSSRFQTQLQAHFGISEPFSNLVEQEGASFKVTVAVHCNHLCSSIIRMSCLRSINTMLGTLHSMHDMYAPWPIFPECLWSFTALPGHLE